MSEENEVSQAESAGRNWLLLGLALIVSILIISAVQENAHKKERAIAASEYDKRSEKEAAYACKRLADSDAFSECVEEKIETDKERYYRNYDLKAQQSMASYTRAAAWFAGVAAFFASVGAYFLVRSSHTTKEMFQRSLDSAEQREIEARRPWLKVRISKFPDDVYEEAGWALMNFVFEVTNVGQIPATNVRLQIRGLGDNIESMVSKYADFTEDFGALIAFPNDPVEINRTIKSQNDGIIDGGEFIDQIDGIIAYSFSGSSKIHFTPFSFFVRASIDSSSNFLLQHSQSQQMKAKPT